MMEIIKNRKSHDEIISRRKQLAYAEKPILYKKLDMGW